MVRSRDFRLLLLGQTTSQFGAQVSGVAIPLLAVVTLEASAFETGLVAASSTLAFALIGLPAGAWIDRYRRRPILVGSDLVRAMLLATIPIAALFDVLSIAQLVVVSLLSGFARVLFDVGYQSYLPTVIGRDRVLAGNSALETIRASGQVAGPGLGGWLVAVLGAATVVMLQAVTFVVSAACLLAIRARETAVPAEGAPAGERQAAGRSDATPTAAGEPTRPGAAPAAGRTRLAAEIGEGLRFVGRSRVLRAVAITSAANNFAFAVASAVTFIFLVRTLGLSPTQIGLVLAAGSVTVMAGAALTPWLSRRFGSARIIWLALAVSGPIGLLGPLAQPGWLVLLFLVSAAAGELGQIVYAITNVSLRQRLVPDRLLGRVNATMRFLLMGLFPLGALLGGILGTYVGARWTLLVAGVLITLSPIPLHRVLRHTRDVESVQLS